MKKLKVIVFWIITSHFIAGVTIASGLSFVNEITFLGTERIAQQLKKVVFAVQVEGNLSNEDKDDDWLSFGTGFLVESKQNRTVGITCYHVINSVQKAEKQLYIGLDKENGYQRFPCKILYMDPKHDVAILEPTAKVEVK